MNLSTRSTFARPACLVLCTWIALTCGAPRLAATTLAWWDFESDLATGSVVDGQYITHTTADGVHQDAVPDLSGNSNHLSAFGDGWGTGIYRQVVPAGSLTGSQFSVQNGGSYPSLSTAGDLDRSGIAVGELAEWTIEASVRFTSLGGYQTMVGKDGVGQAFASGDSAAAPLYFQKTSGNVFSIRYIDAAGYQHLLDGSTTVEADTWYNVAATSDGDSLRIYVDGNLDAAYDLTASGSSNRAMAALDESGQEGNSGPAYSWSLLRGMYDDEHRDRVQGYLDDVRISDVALAVDDLLNPYASALSLVVNTETGEVRIRNNGSTAISLDYYRIDSPTDSALLVDDYDGTSGWYSLSDQQVDASGDGSGIGETWDEAQASVLSSQLLVENFLLGNTTLAAGESRWLGVPVDVERLAGDLVFQYAEPGGSLKRARIEYTSEVASLPGDFNDDGTVNLADYVVWRDNLGVADEHAIAGNGDGAAGVDFGDYRLWRLQFGNTLDAASGLTASQVPEPTGGLLAVIGLTLLTQAVRKRVCRYFE
ncbi:LamG domain-containing protein [Aeoliella mucimassa]|uniref:LamG-like jellyroll fold domain-containing protein n=1 Tax=Aeoliella mucimassa TaxID=2527972 RepID=A0A518AV82_9BACT|nr:LamG domain-containing protein [Aeoliella mucimassa]QDU58639.1 hypothetical protein Pan181_48780 [Aeoliella mucimassa]